MPSRKSRLSNDAIDLLDVEPRARIPETPTAVAVATVEPSRRVMMNTRIDVELVASARRVAQLSGETLTAFIATALQNEIKRRRKGLADKLKAEAAALLLGE